MSGSPGARAAIALAVTVAATALAILMLGDGAYLYVKAVHVMAIIAWMAGMLYLPRLFVYHAEAPKGSAQSDTFKVMEKRLLTIIVNPAMVVAWVLGLWLAHTGSFFSSPWMHVKLAAVLVLSGLHGFFAGAVRRFAEDRNTVLPRTWRMLNEAPAVLMIIIVLMVIVKPWA